MKRNKLYTFTVGLKNVSAATPCLEDSLFECGCEDALINYRVGTVYLDFDRQADNFEDAVISAVKNIRSSSIKAEVSSISPSDYVTTSEIAKRLNTNRQTVLMWIKQGRCKAFPHPVLRISKSSPFWSWASVTKWLYDNQIITDLSFRKDSSNLRYAMKKNRRNIGQEILDSLREIKAWKHGRNKLKATKVRPRSRDFKTTITTRAAKDASFRKELLSLALTELTENDFEVGKSMLQTFIIVAREKVLKHNPFIPNRATVVAIKAARKGNVTAVDGLENLFKSLETHR